MQGNSRKTISRVAQGIFATTGLLMAVLPATSYADTSMPIDFHAWNGFTQFAGGTFSGTRVGLVDGRPAVTLSGATTTGSWTSAAYNPHVPIAKLVSSWQATTPADSWIETDLSVEVNGQWSNWYDMGQWALDSNAKERTSVSNQADANGSISQDTYYDNTTAGTQYRLKETFHGNTTGAQPAVWQVAATASNPTTVNETASQTTMAHSVNLPVPGYSQYVHDGEYPQFDGGGEAWCSPTSVAMVLQYWGKSPTGAQVASLPADPVFDANHRVDGTVDYAAYHIFDYSPDQLNTGDWPFNMAYAASYGLDTSVRQYDSLRGVEQWIKQGVPVVVSIAWNNTDGNPDNDLTGASIASTTGHLLVVRGFTANGDVIVNDPASPSDTTVEHVYNRAQFERDWLNHSDGTVYVVKPLAQH